MRFLKRDGDLLESLITECIRVKADVVSADEREGGERRILNFGHTIGHALEAETDYKQLLHGEAVGWGMIAAARIGEQHAGDRPRDGAAHCRLVLAYGPLPKVEVNAKQRDQAVAVRQEDGWRRAAFRSGDRSAR